MKIVITGGAGFVGSSLCILLKTKYPEYNIIAFDNLKRRGSELNVIRLREVGVNFIHGDIRIQADLNNVGAVDCIIDAAAEPSVMAGITSSVNYLIETNLGGTINTLLYANNYKSNFIFLSTSRVYPIATLGKIRYTEEANRFIIAPSQIIEGITTNGISEDFPLKGSRSFYGATKLASELLIEEFNQFSGIKSVINRCGVIAGPWQMGKIDQGVTALWVARHLWEKSLSYIGYGGEGKQVRDILHIQDLFNLIDWQIHNLAVISGQTFNVGGGLNCSYSLKELTQLCEKSTANKIEINQIQETRDADIPIYITDNSKVSKMCNWQPKMTPEKIVTDVYNWMYANQQSLSSILNV